MRRHLLVIGALAISTTGALIACGGDDSGGGTADVDASTSDAAAHVDATHADVLTPPVDAAKDSNVPVDGFVAPFDAGADTNTPVDANGPDVVEPPRDAGIDTGVDANVPPPPGLLLGAGADSILWGITSANEVVYSQGSNLFAVPIAGGAPDTISTAFSVNASVMVQGALVAYWNFDNQAGAVGELDVWSKATGNNIVAMTSRAQLFAVSTDGLKIAYTDNTTADQKDLYVASPNGSGAVDVLPKTYRYSCNLNFRFAGNTLFTQHCEAPPADAGAEMIAGTISSFASPTYATKVDLVSGVQDINLVAADYIFHFNVDTAGQTVYAALAAPPMNGEVINAASKAVTHVDTGASEGLFDSLGADVVYASTSGALKRSPVAVPVPVQLVASGAAGLIGLSPDDGTVAYFSQGTTTATSITTDFRLASAKIPSAGFAVDATVDAFAFRDVFTPDSKYAVFQTGSNANTGIGTLKAASTLTGTATTISATNWEWMALSGSLGLIDDNAAVVGTRIVADVRIIDMSGVAAPKTVVAQAYGGFLLSTDHKTVVYGTTSAPAGVYAVALP